MPSKEKPKQVNTTTTTAAPSTKVRPPKTECPVSRATFKKKATPIIVDIGGVKLMADPRQFGTGSLGWFLGDKITIQIDGKPCKVQMSCSLTLVGSKELPMDNEGEEEEATAEE